MRSPLKSSTWVVEPPQACSPSAVSDVESVIALYAPPNCGLPSTSLDAWFSHSLALLGMNFSVPDSARRCSPRNTSAQPSPLKSPTAIGRRRTEVALEPISSRTTGKLGTRVALTSFQSGAGLSKVRLR